METNENKEEPYSNYNIQFGGTMKTIESKNTQNEIQNYHNNQNKNINNKIEDNLYYDKTNPHAQEIELNDFIINIEDSDKRMSSESNKKGKISLSENNNSIEIVPSLYRDNNISNINNNTNNNNLAIPGMNHFAKTIVVLNNTENNEKKEEIDSGVNFVNSINPNLNNKFFNSNPNQRKFSTPPKRIMNENESVLFFFINPTSGIQSGKHLINMGVKKVEFTDNLHCTAHIFNMNDEFNCNNGIETLRSELSRVSLIRVIIGGGDGSILPMIEKLKLNQIDLNRCIFGVLPLGRSNDLSRALGWGENMDITSDMAKFKLIVHDLAEATSIFVDVWEIKLTCDQNEGAIIEFDQNNNKKKIKYESTNKVTTMKKYFINYFSLGFDARVGFGFNKSKSSCRCGNICLYFWEGIKKQCCRKTLPVNGFIDSFSIVKLEDDDTDFISNNNNNNNQDNLQNETVKENEAPKDLVFRTINPSGLISESSSRDSNNQVNNLDIDYNIQNIQNIQNIHNIHNIQNSNNINVSKSNTFKGDKDTNNQKETYQKIILKGNPVSLVCQNINYFIGGPADVWRNSHENFGLQVYDPSINKNDKKAVEVKRNSDKEKFRDVFKNSEQKLNDQKLEFFTYSSTWKLGSVKVTSSDTDKVYHGEGPIIINFKDTASFVKIKLFNKI